MSKEKSISPITTWYDIDVHTGGGVSVGLDDEGVAAYTEAFNDVATTSDVKDRIVNSDVARDSTDKCDVMSQFASTGKTLNNLITTDIIN